MLWIVFIILLLIKDSYATLKNYQKLKLFIPSTTEHERAARSNIDYDISDINIDRTAYIK